jgi:hypothetical protein
MPVRTIQSQGIACVWVDLNGRQVFETSLLETKGLSARTRADLEDRQTGLGVAFVHVRFLGLLNVPSL